MADQWQLAMSAANRDMAQRRYRDAAINLRSATALRPDHADSWFNLGYALRQIRDYPGALDAYAQALGCGVSGPESAHVNRAVILSDYLERTEEAEQELRAALALNRNFLPAWLNLGGLMEDVGRPEEAADAYREALRIAPGNGSARARLCALRAHKGEAEVALQELEDQLRRGADSHDDMAEMLFAYGNMLDTVERYGEAFAAITQANHINAALRPAEQRYDPKAQEALIDALIACFPAAPASSERVAGSAGEELVFICGMFRSGSTVIEQLLGRHACITVGGELELIPALVHEHLLPYPASLSKMAAETQDLLRAQYLNSITTNFPDATLVTDKRPDNFLHIGLIKTLFPAARIVLTERAALDNLVSIYFLNFAETINYSDRIDDIAHYIRQYHRLADHWRKIFRDEIVTVDYDRLVQHPETVMAETFNALGLSQDHLKDKEAPSTTIIRTPSNWKARAPINGRSSGRWKNYADQLAAARAMLGTIE